MTEIIIIFLLVVAVVFLVLLVEQGKNSRREEMERLVRAESKRQSKWGFLDYQGNPVAGGLLHFFEPETTISKAIFADKSLHWELPNPIVLDPDGNPQQQIYLGDGSYDVRLLTQDHVLLWQRDNISLVTVTPKQPVFGMLGFGSHG